MQIENTETSKLIPYANNSRTHSESQVKQIAASIKEFGFINPVIVDKNNGIIAGHGRVMAAELLGLETVPTLKADHLTEAQKKAYIIADNQLALNSDWNLDLLKVEIEGLQEVDFNVDLLGFDDGFFSVPDVPEIKDNEVIQDNFEDDMKMTFNFSYDQFQEVSEKLNRINESKEIALLELLSNV